MSTPRERSAWHFKDYAGGLVMFVAEILIVAGLAAVAWVFAIVILSIV